MLSLAKEQIGEDAIEATYRRFERWHAARAGFQCAAFLAGLGVLIVRVG